MSDSLVPVGVTTPTDANISFIFFVALYISDGPEHKVKQIPSALHKCYELRPKDVYQVHLGPHSVTNHSTKTQTDLRRKLWCNGPESMKSEGMLAVEFIKNDRQHTPTPRLCSSQAKRVDIDPEDQAKSRVHEIGYA